MQINKNDIHILDRPGLKMTPSRAAAQHGSSAMYFWPNNTVRQNTQTQATNTWHNIESSQQDKAQLYICI